MIMQYVVIWPTRGGVNGLAGSVLMGRLQGHLRTWNIIVTTSTSMTGRATCYRRIDVTTQFKFEENLATNCSKRCACYGRSL